MNCVRNLESSYRMCFAQRVALDLLDAYACIRGAIARLVSSSNEYDDWVAMNWMRTCLMLLIFAMLLGPEATHGQDPTQWFSGRKLDLQAQEAAVSIDWQHAPLRQRLREFAANQRISIFLDRRIDGSQEIRFSAVNVSFEQLLWRLCDRIDAGMCRVENTYYIGPKDSAAALPAILAELKGSVSSSTSSSQKRRWKRAVELSSPRLSEPREILRQICQSLDSEAKELDRVPHDLWDVTQVAESSAALRISLLLIGFSKTVELSKDLREVAVIDYAIPKTIVREFTVGDKVKTVGAMVEREFPDLSTTVKRRSIVVEGSVEQVLAVHRAMVKMQEPEIAALSDQKFDLKVSDQRIKILRSVAAQVSRKLSFPPDQALILQGRVQMELKGATANDIIKKTLEGTDLTFRFTDEALEILEK